MNLKNYFLFFGLLQIQSVFSNLIQTSMLQNSNHSVKTISLAEKSINHFKKGNSIQFECPVDEILTSSQNSKFQNYLITWFKNKNKINHFFNSDTIGLNKRIKIQDNKLTINYLFKIDAGVYNCEVITGSGLNLKSSNVTLEFVAKTSDSPIEIQKIMEK